MDAIGLLCYLLSLPHDWVIYKTKLHEQFGCGRKRMDSSFNELRDKGYVLTVEKIGEDNLKSYEHIVYDKPFNGESDVHSRLTQNGYTDNRHTEIGLTEKEQLLNTNKQSKDNKVNNNKVKNTNIPVWEEFKTYALSLKSDVDVDSLELKYKSWLENGWKNGNDKPIKNWKSAVLNTLPYIKTNNQVAGNLNRFKQKESFTQSVIDKTAQLEQLFKEMDNTNKQIG